MDLTETDVKVCVGLNRLRIGNAPLYFIKCEEFLNQLSNYQLFKKTLYHGI
jgi:hypothetical protein